MAAAGNECYVGCMAERRYRGGCLCGGVRYELTGEVRNLCYCHCNSCRRASGGLMVAWGTVDRNAFRVMVGALVEYRSSPPVLRGFCAACGGALTYRHEERPGEIDFTLVTLDEPAELAPERHLWVADKLPWVKISDGLPQYPTGSVGTAP
jgi:hypothetical protein